MTPCALWAAINLLWASSPEKFALIVSNSGARRAWICDTFLCERVKSTFAGKIKSLNSRDNKIIVIESNIPVNNDTIKIVENEGLYSDDIKDFGSIIFKLKVSLQSNLSDDQKTIINKYFD